MNHLCTLDGIQHLHWQIIKSVLSSLLLIPILSFSHDLWHYSQDSEQIFIIFFALTLFGTSLMLTFIQALQLNYQKLDTHIERKYHRWIELYQSVPLLFFTGLIIAFSTRTFA